MRQHQKTQPFNYHFKGEFNPMNYYYFHISDYRAATAHLTNEEDLAYRRLIEMYYDQEAPIPLETNWLARRLRIGSDVLERVLNDFFFLTENGWRHHRCDEEIDNYHKKQKTAQENGKKGGRKKADNSLRIKNNSKAKTKSLADRNPLGSELEPNPNPESSNCLPNQSPLSNNQDNSLNPPTPLAGGSERKGKSRPWSDDFTPNETTIEYVKQHNRELEYELCRFRDYCLAHGKKYIDWQGAFRNWITSPFNKPPNGSNHNGNKTIQQQRFEANNYIFNRGRNAGAGGRTIDAPDEDSVRRQIESKLPF